MGALTNLAINLLKSAGKDAKVQEILASTLHSALNTRIAARIPDQNPPPLDHAGWQAYSKGSLAKIRGVQETEASTFPLPSAGGRGRGRGGDRGRGGPAGGADRGRGGPAGGVPRGAPPRGGGPPVGMRGGRGGRGMPPGRGRGNFPEVEILVPAGSPPTQGD